MPDYHVYCIDEQNRIVRRYDYIRPNDEAAIQEARQHCGSYEIEVWEGARLVARLAKDGTPSSQPSSGPRES